MKRMLHCSDEIGKNEKRGAAAGARLPSDGKVAKTLVFS
jgi:hypothetical protein